MPVNFDVDAARKSGYSDTEIADAIAAKSNFNAAGARQAGFADADIIQRLTASPTPSPTRTTPVDVDAHVAAALKQEAEGMGTMDAITVGAGRTFDAVGRGVQQLWNGVTGNEVKKAELQGKSQRADRLYQPIKDAHPIATAVGESLPSMVVPVGGAGGTLATMGRVGAAAAVPSTLEYGSAEERAKRTAMSGIGGIVGGVVLPKIAGAAINAGKSALKGLAGNITAEALALAARAKELGIPVNAAQLGDSKFLKTLASTLEQIPFTGANKATTNQREAFNTAVAKTFGADAKKVTPEVYTMEKKRLGEQFNDLAARNELDVNPVLTSKLRAVVDEAESTGSSDSIRAVNNILNRVANQHIEASGKLPGKVYSSIDSELSNIIKAGGEKGMYAKRMQEVIRSGMDESISAADQAAWKTTRSEYKNLKAVRDMVAKEGADGNVNPSQLMNALNSTQAGKEAMAMGTRGTLGELGQIGKRFVRDQVPNSGTAQRMVAMGVIGGGGFAAGADPATIASLMVGGATTGRMINKILNNPKTIEALGRQGMTLTELAKLPPSKITQILGGITGMTAAELQGD